MEHKDNKHEKHHHHILPNSVILTIGGLLLLLTGVTVWVAHIDLGKLNFVIAMLVASIKASMVALFFMNLKYDKKENGVIFATSFLFLAIFLVLTSMDLFFRGDVYVKGAIGMPTTQVKSKLKDPWVSTPELVAKGRELFAAQCVACHGAEGKGDGAAAAALIPHPRNFTSDQGWKNGRKPSQVFKTLKEGLAGSAMASFATLPADDRWALAQYVLSLGPKAPTDSPEDLAKVGITPGGGAAEEEKTLPVEFAMKRLAQTETTANPRMFHGVVAEAGQGASEGARIYSAHCIQCHGARAEGGYKVRNLGVNPEAFVVTEPLSGKSSGLQSAEHFSHLVVMGLPGELMPGNGQLTSAEMRELFQYVKGIANR